MARYLYPAHESMNFSDAKWSTADDDAQDETKPEAGDDVDCSHLSLGGAGGTLTLDENSAALHGFYGNVGSGFAGTLALGNKTLSATNAAMLLGNYTGSTGNKITCGSLVAKLIGSTFISSDVNVELTGTTPPICNSAGGGNLFINTAGTITITETQYWDSFTLTAGTYVDSGVSHYIAGTIHIVTGTFTSTGKWTMTASGNLAANSSARSIAELEIGAGTTATMTNSTFYKKATVNATATLTGTANFYCYAPPANDFLDMAGTVSDTVTVTIFSSSARSNAGQIKGGIFNISTTSDAISTTGVLTIATTTKLYGGADNNYAQLVLGVTGSSLAALVLGSVTGTNRYGKIDFGNGNYAIAIESAATAAAGLTNEMDFGDVILTLSGTIDGTDISCIGEAAGSGDHAVVHGGTVQNVSMPLDDEALDATDSANGGGNSNVWFSGCNGGHQIIGCGIIGSAVAA